jgi:hypothetical protein
LFASVFSLALLTASPAFAVMEDYPSVKLQGLDKSVGRTVTFEAKVGSTIQYGPLFIKIQACRKAPPIEKPESAAFLQIWEVPPGEEKSEWSFSGWMFASSPALSAMDHPVYDVWVLDCTGREEPNEEAAAAESDKEADQESLPTDSEALTTEESIPTDSEAAPEETAPIPEEAIPTDSEAEPENPAPSEQQAPAVDPNAAYSPDAAYQPPQPAPVDPNATAYDIMKQQGTNAAPPAPQQAPAPMIDPNAPYSPPR